MTSAHVKYRRAEYSKLNLTVLLVIDKSISDMLIGSGIRSRVRVTLSPSNLWQSAPCCLANRGSGVGGCHASSGVSLSSAVFIIILQCVDWSMPDPACTYLRGCNIFAALHLTWAIRYAAQNTNSSVARPRTRQSRFHWAVKTRSRCEWLIVR